MAKMGNSLRCVLDVPSDVDMEYCHYGGDD